MCSSDLLHLGNLDSTSSLNSTPLHYAVLGGNEETVRFLVSRGAQVQASNAFQETPLHWACKEGNLSIVRFLLQQNAIPDSKDSKGNTPMHWAAEFDQEKVVLLLFEYGSPSLRLTKNADSLTPRQVAKQNKSKNASKALRRSRLRTPNSSSHPLLARR